MGMDVLETELQEAILSKLPAVSLFRCSAVSKIWLGIIDDSTFRRTYQSKVRIFSGVSCRENWNSSHVFYKFTSDRCSVLAKEIFTTVAEEFSGLRVRSYCYGLFYMDNYEFARRGRRGSLVFNPFMKEALMVSYAPDWMPYGHSRHVLGFDPSTGTFKLLDLSLRTLIRRSSEQPFIISRLNARGYAKLPDISLIQLNPPISKKCTPRTLEMSTCGRE
ncbi:hypothetical protein MLD38_039004 [Melastoma candidum]|uniref:Uncharacterized protein n=1 Tax=Melastoma candidum TaxID=119954 RepID=A0ACB9L1R3_9MYRT|nr:hypothetical protein MLD38_039004 [Melastoma candidum]